MPFIHMSKWYFPVATIFLVCISLLTGVLSCSGDKPNDNPVDKIPPTVISTVPVDGDSSVSVNTDVSVTFSEPMDAGVMVSGVLTLNPPASGVTGYSNRVLTFTPSTALNTNVNYTATVSTAVCDTAGNTLAAPYVWHFSTYRDTIPPTVISTTPARDDSATVNTLISINFSEQMDVSTLNSSTILFDSAIAGSFAIQANRQFVFTPAQPLDTFVVYTATVTTAVTDSAGNHMADNYVWQFHTIRDMTPPVIMFVQPADQTVFKDSLRLQVAVSDNDRMSHVEFYTDSVLIPGASDSTAPYEYTWRPTGLVLGTEHSIYARAYDEAGNIGSTDTVTVHYLWHLLVEDNNEAIPRNLARLYYRNSRTQLSFRVETYNGWGDYKSPTEGIDVAIFLDIDQNSATGQTTTDGGNQQIGDLGVEYRIVVGNHGDVLDRWNGTNWIKESDVDELVISNNSNFFEVSIGLPQILEPQFIDLLVANVVLSEGLLLWDWAPNLGHVTATVDHSFSTSSKPLGTGPVRQSQAASSLISPFD